MRRPYSLLASLISLVSLAALGSCGLYFGGDDDPCDNYGGAPPGYDTPGLRNPDTGVCESFGGGPYPCDGTCGPCPATTDVANGAAQAAQPSWGLCQSQCTGLDEQTCQDTSGCRAVYMDCFGGDCGQPTFAECWSTDMTGPIEGGGCEGLDAYTCSQHDDCVAIHASSCDPPATGGLTPTACVPANFLRCGDEPGSTGDAGLCYAEVTCTDPMPDCPADTQPGILDGCWTGFCIPVAECEEQPACADVPAEGSCIARADCEPLYRGEDCTCDDTGCTCASHVFEGCTDGPTL